MEIESLGDLAQKRIRELIITGAFKPGQQLKEEELCSRFQISRPPIREAFKMLEAEGLVTRRPRRGVFVAEMTAKDIWEIYTLKAVTYQMAASLAMAVMTAEDVAALEAAVARMAAVAAGWPVDLRQYQLHHRTFHETIMTLAGNERLSRIERNLRYQVSRISYTSLNDPGHLRDSVAYHRRIAAAMRQGDRPLACRLMKEHVLDALDVALRLLPGESGRPASGAGPFPADADLLEVAL